MGKDDHEDDRRDDGDATSQAVVGDEGGAAPLGGASRVSRRGHGPMDRSPSDADDREQTRNDLNDVDRK